MSTAAEEAPIERPRLAALQDGVYAIAMTLLVLELKLPAFGETFADAALWSALLGLWPKLLGLLLSFWVLALFWESDARILTAAPRVDAPLLRLAQLRLLLVSLLPFSSALIGEHGNHAPAAAVYAGHLMLLALIQVIQHLRVRRALADAAAGGRGLQAWATLACSAAALGLAFVAPGYNMFALAPILFLRLLQRFRPCRQAGKP